MGIFVQKPSPTESLAKLPLVGIPKPGFFVLHKWGEALAPNLPLPSEFPRHMKFSHLGFAARSFVASSWCPAGSPISPAGRGRLEIIRRSQSFSGVGSLCFGSGSGPICTTAGELPRLSPNHHRCLHLSHRLDTTQISPPASAPIIHDSAGVAHSFCWDWSLMKMSSSVEAVCRW